MKTRSAAASVFIIFLLFCFTVYGQDAHHISPHDYINTYKDIAVEKRIEFGIPASITLAQGFLESGFGNSPLAVNANNHFGIKCHLGWTGGRYYHDDDEKDECFRKYKSAETSYQDHSIFLTTRSRYNFLFDYNVTDYKSWAHGLRKAGYATNPRYGYRLVDIIERYGLHKFDTMSLKEVRRYTYGEEEPPAVVSAPEKEPSPVEAPKPPSSTSDRRQHTHKSLEVNLHNRIKYVVARDGDTPASIAEEMGLWEWQIERYNELEGNRKVTGGDTIYLQPKRRRGSQEVHHVKAGESMYDISQRYGIRLNQLYRRNRMDPGTEPRPGQKLYLQRRKPRS